MHKSLQTESLSFSFYSIKPFYADVNVTFRQQHQCDSLTAPSFSALTQPFHLSAPSSSKCSAAAVREPGPGSAEAGGSCVWPSVCAGVSYPATWGREAGRGVWEKWAASSGVTFPSCVQANKKS